MSEYPEFVEFAGKKEYKCSRCKTTIRYAKFFGPDKKVLTTDGKEPYFDRDKKPMSNTGWPTDPITKQMHECKGDGGGNLIVVGPVTEEHNSQPLTEMDKKVRDKMIDDAYHDAQFTIFTLNGVEKACKDSGIELGPISGMIFKAVCENIRRRNERE